MMCAASSATTTQQDQSLIALASHLAQVCSSLCVLCVRVCVCVFSCVLWCDVVSLFITSVFIDLITKGKVCTKGIGLHLLKYKHLGV